MNWWLGWLRAFATSAKPSRWITRCASWWHNVCSRSPAVIRTRMTRPVCPKIRLTNCFWTVIRRHAKRLRHRTYRVTIDLDPTDDPTHGAQQLSFFNHHYDSWCYLPVMGFVSFNDEAEQYLCAAVLRPGNVTAA